LTYTGVFPLPENNTDPMPTKIKLNLLIALVPALFLSFENNCAQPVTLPEFIDAALTNNPVLKSAANETTISGKEIRIARSERYARVFLESNAGFTNEFSKEDDYKYLNTRIYAEQLLWQNRKVDATLQQARYNALATNSSFDGSRQDLILAVKTAYFNCQQQFELYRLAEDNTRHTALLLDYAFERSKLGTGKRSDVLKAESDRSQAEFEEERYHNAFRSSVNDLIALTGLSPGVNWKPDSIKLEEPAITTCQSADSLIQLAVSEYPELQAALNREFMQKEAEKASRALLYPSLSVNTGYAWSDDPTFGQQKNWSALLTLRWNLFSGKENQYRLQCEQIRTEKLRYQTEAIRLDLIRNINNWLISLDEARQQIDLFRLMKTTTREGLESAKAQFMAGTGSMLELTDARITDLMTNKNFIQAITMYRISLANLERLTGKTNEKE
jgi:outer membrane protein TolC